MEVEVRHVEEGRRFEDTFVDIEDQYGDYSGGLIYGKKSGFLAEECRGTWQILMKQAQKMKASRWKEQPKRVEARNLLRLQEEKYGSDSFR